jgi:hypothetical protein
METTTTSLIGRMMVKAFIAHTPLATSRHRNLHEPRVPEHTRGLYPRKASCSSFVVTFVGRKQQRQCAVQLGVHLQPCAGSESEFASKKLGVVCGPG